MPLPHAKKQHGESRRIHLFNFGCIEYQPGVDSLSGTFELAAFPGAPTTSGGDAGPRPGEAGRERCSRQRQD